MRLEPNYVACEFYQGVRAPLSIEALWDPPGWFGPKGICHLLQQHPAVQDTRGRMEQCFFHLKLYFSPKVVELDRRGYQGLGRDRLIRALEQAHQDAFGAFVPPGEQVRYQVLPGPGLKEDEVVVQYGRAVHVPAPQQQPRWTVQARMEGEWRVLARLYPDQRLTQLHGDICHSSVPIEYWPFHQAALLLLQETPGQAPEILAEPLDSLDIEPAGAGEYRIENRGGDQLRLRIRPWQQPAADDVSARVEPDEEANKAGFGWREGATVMPQPGRAVQLVGMALQRLDNYSGLGLSRLCIGLDETGMPVSASGRPQAARLCLQHDNSLWLEQEGGRLPLRPDGSIQPLATGRSLILAPPPAELVATYLAILRLPDPIRYPLPPGGSLLFGRGQNARISPALLAGSELTSDSVTEPPPVEAEKLGFSRELARVSASDEGMQVVPMQPGRLWHLDAEGKLLQTLDDEARILKPGEHLLGGHYLLQYQE